MAPLKYVGFVASVFSGTWISYLVVLGSMHLMGFKASSFGEKDFSHFPIRDT